MLNELCGIVQSKLKSRGTSCFVFKLPVRQVEFSGLFLGGGGGGGVGVGGCQGGGSIC